MKRLLAFAVTTLLILSAASAYAGTIVINSDTSDPAPRAAIQQLVDKFNKAHAEEGIKAKLNIYDHESYKTSVRNWLTTEAPEIIFWYTGERLRKFVASGLLEPVSEVFQQNNLAEKMASTVGPVTFDGEQYALPYTYYQWGVYYRKDIFDKFGLKAPKTWEEFKHVCATLHKNGITPITMGSRGLWPVAGWFDYLNLRINGLDFHMKLMAGEIPYTDDRVREVFKYWKELVEPGYYTKNHTSYSWQEAQAFMYQGKSAMFLLGNFVVSMFPEEVAENMSFFQFPRIKPDMPFYEDAPTDTLSIPARAKNKKEAKMFLSFLAQPENIRAMNDALLQLPTHKDAGVTPDKYLSIGNKMLSEAAGTAQFYDRDTDPAMAKVGMKGFQEFMVKPERLDKILMRLDKSRQRIFKK